MAIKVTVNLPEEIVDALDALAKKRGVTKTEALRQAIANEKFLQDKQDEGSEILLRGKNTGTERLLMR